MDRTPALVTGSSGPDVVELGPAVDALDLQTQVAQLLERGPSRLVVDLSQAHLSSSTIATLMWVKRQAAARGAAMVLRGPDRRLADLLQRSGLLDTLLAQESPTSPGR